MCCIGVTAINTSVCLPAMVTGTVAVWYNWDCFPTPSTQTGLPILTASGTKSSAINRRCQHQSQLTCVTNTPWYHNIWVSCGYSHACNSSCICWSLWNSFRAVVPLMARLPTLPTTGLCFLVVFLEGPAKLFLALLSPCFELILAGSSLLPVSKVL